MATGLWSMTDRTEASPSTTCTSTSWVVAACIGPPANCCLHGFCLHPAVHIHHDEAKSLLLNVNSLSRGLKSFQIEQIKHLRKPDCPWNYCTHCHSRTLHCCAQSRLTRQGRAVGFQDKINVLLVCQMKTGAGEWLSFINIKKWCR